MSDFHYDIKETNHYYIDDITIYGKSVQDGTPTPSNPVPVQVVEPVSGDSIYLNCGDEQIEIDLQGNVLASLPDGTRDVLTVDGVGHVTLIKRVADVILDDSLAWSLNAYSGDVNTVFTLSDAQFNAQLPGIYTAARLTTNQTESTHFVANPVTGAAIRDLPGIAIRNETDTKVLWVTVPLAIASNVDEFKSWLSDNQVYLYYPLATPQTIDLNPIDLPSKSDEPYTVSVTASITPETAINQTNKPTYEVENQYEHIPGAKMEIPPVHPLMQEWETFDPDNWDEQSMMNYTYQDEWHAVYTVYLGELMQSGVFDWSRPELDWSDAAIDEEQYKRVCDYFNLRFKWREISMLPVLKWFDYLHNKLVYELMPKYKPLYERVAEGVNPLSDNSEYRKSRSIDSAYPETLLSQNADYITQGNDFEEQKIHEAGTADAIVNFADVYKGVDQLLLDELEVMFISLYTTNINGL